MISAGLCDETHQEVEEIGTVFEVKAEETVGLFGLVGFSGSDPHRRIVSVEPEITTM